MGPEGEVHLPLARRREARWGYLDSFMRYFLAGVIVVCSLATGWAQTVSPDFLKPENRSTSSSGGFTIFGGTRQDRSQLGRRAEEIKEKLWKELKVSRDEFSPILLVLPLIDGVRLRQREVLVQVFDAAEAGRKIQVDIAPAARADSPAVDRGILNALLLQVSLKSQKFSGDRYVNPPSWLVASMGVVLRRRQPSEDARIYSALLEGKGMPRPKKFFAQKEDRLRGRAKEVYLAQSFALYQSLVELPQGKDKVLQNLTLAEPARDPLTRFGQTWPTLAEDTSRLVRLWALSIADLSSSRNLQLLSSSKTSAGLDQVLFPLQDGQEGNDLGADFLTLSRTEEGRLELKQAAVQLQRLGFRSHPLYHPLVEEYREMIERLSRKKRGGFVRKFSEVEELRLALDARCAEMTDFVDWYQANDEATGPLLAMEQQRAKISEEASRNDAISRFMDSVEGRGW